MICRHCSASLEHTFIDLGFSPPSNAYLCCEDLFRPEKYYPLRVRVCTQCWLVQTEDYTAAEDLFKHDYAYFSSTSKSWLKHAVQFAEKIIGQLQLTKNSLVIEVASNDGYLLKNFISAEIPCLGIEPTVSTAEVAEKIGIPVIHDFFTELLGRRLASSSQQADLIIGNNVYAHVPDINNFTRGLKAALKPFGTISLEFPHLMRLLEFTQFDTIYHEHFSYLSLYTVERIFGEVGLRIWDVEELTTHGGSLRIYGCHTDDPRQPTTRMKEILNAEKRHGLLSLETYRSFQEKSYKIKDDFLLFLIEQKRKGRKVAAYGAAAKGNTLLNYAGVKPDLLPFICDAAEAKQGKYMPGSHIPILAPSVLDKQRPDFLVILPWNIADEVKEQNNRLAKLGTKFLTVIPNLSTTG